MAQIRSDYTSPQLTVESSDVRQVNYSTRFYRIIVENGDTLESIALRLGVTADVLYSRNRGVLGDLPCASQVQLTSGITLLYYPPLRGRLQKLV